MDGGKRGNIGLEVSQAQPEDLLLQDKEKTEKGISFQDRKFFRDNSYRIETRYDPQEGKAEIRIFKNGKLTSSKNIKLSEQEGREEIKSKLRIYHRVECSLLDSVFKMYERMEGLKDGTAHHRLGEVFLGMELLDEAEEQFLKAISKAPDLSLAYNSVGLVYLRLGKKDQAVKSFEKALKANPLYADYLNNYGFAFMEKKMYSQAAQQFEKALQINPRYEDVYLNLGFCYLIKSSSADEIFSDSNKILALNYFKKAYKVSLRRDPRIGRAIQRARDWEDLSRLYMLLKSSLDEEDIFTIKSLCDYFSLRFRYDPDALDERELSDYLYLLNQKIREGKNYPDLRAGLASAYLFYSRFVLRSAKERFLQEKEESVSLHNLSLVEKLAQDSDHIIDTINP